MQARARTRAGLPVIRNASPALAVKDYAAIYAAVRGGRSIRAGTCPVNEGKENCRAVLTASSTAVTAITGGGA